MPASVQQRGHAVERAGKVFAIVKRATEMGEVCPTNAVLAERFGVRANTISAAFNFLEANGMIAVERGPGCRVVTIVASGHSTAQPIRLRSAA